jgi:hypothetical protein
MKREFLQNFKVGDQPLTKEIIDAIMAENGRDIEEAKKPFADYESIKNQLQTAKDSLKAFDGMDVQQLQGQITKLQNDLTAKETEYNGKIADMQFESVLKDAITAAKGRNAKAITALLDVDTLKASKNQSDDIKAALEGLKKDSGYLFETEQTTPPPPFAPGTGTGGSNNGGGSAMDSIWRAAGLTPPGSEKK